MSKSHEFDGEVLDVAVGEVRAIRSFKIRDDGALLSLTYSAAPPWQAELPCEENVATCDSPERHAAAAANCTCGFYAYGHPGWGQEYQQFTHVQAVISCYGQMTYGTKGLRAQKAWIDALWLGPQVSLQVEDIIRDKNPQLVIYRDRDQMLVDYPLTQLPTYEQEPGEPSPERPDVSGGRFSGAPRFMQLSVLALLLVTLILGGSPPTGGVYFLTLLVTFMGLLGCGAVLHRLAPRWWRWLRYHGPVLRPAAIAPLGIGTTLLGDPAARPILVPFYAFFVVIAAAELVVARRAEAVRRFRVQPGVTVLEAISGPGWNWNHSQVAIHRTLSPAAAFLRNGQYGKRITCDRGAIIFVPDLWGDGQSLCEGDAVELEAPD